MNFSQYYPTDMLNGPGIRSVLFLSGCSHGCKGCYNQSAWNPNSGEEFTKDIEDRIITDLNDTRIKRSGLSLSGGDPLHQRNLEGVNHIINRVRKECPGKTIWMWTGYTINQLKDLRLEVAKSVDVLVDGRFEESLYDPNLKFRGSSNQHIIEIKNL